MKGKQSMVKRDENTKLSGTSVIANGNEHRRELTQEVCLIEV